MKKLDKLTPSQRLDKLSGEESTLEKLDYFTASSIGWINIGIGAGLIGILLITLILHFYLRTPIVFYGSEKFLWWQKTLIVLGVILYSVFSGFFGYCQFISHESKKPVRVFVYFLGIVFIFVSANLIVNCIIPQCLFSDLRGTDTSLQPI